MTSKRKFENLSREEIFLISSLYLEIRFKGFKDDETNQLSVSDLDDFLIPQAAANADYIDSEEWVF